MKFYSAAVALLAASSFPSNRPRMSHAHSIGEEENQEQPKPFVSFEDLALDVASFPHGSKSQSYAAPSGVDSVAVRPGATTGTGAAESIAIGHDSSVSDLVPTNMPNTNNLRNGNLRNRNLHDVPKNYYYHDKCEEAPPPVCDKCDTCGYKRNHDYYQAMMDKWAKTEESRMADGQWYAPSDKTITCGATITEFTKLTSDLFCNADDGSSGLVLSGPNAVLDCAKFSIAGPLQEANSDSIGILLQNGAMAVNCNIFGFFHAVKMDGGNNVLKDSRVVRSGDSNISTEGVGCMVIENVESSYSARFGIEAEHEGDINIYNVKVNANKNDGVRIQSNVECANLENIEAIGNERDGIESNNNRSINIINAKATANDGNGVIIESNVECANLENIEAFANAQDGINLNSIPMVGLSGTITSEFNDDDGLEIFCFISGPECEVKVFADVILNGHRGSGIHFDGNQPLFFTVDVCGTVKACGNEIDVDGDDMGPPTIMGEITCDTTSIAGTLLPDDFDCQDGCFANVGSGTICQSPVHAYCYPKPGW